MVILRKISSTVLIIATLLLLMNGILPHHHHHEEVCYTSSHCSDEDTNHHGIDTEHSGVNHNHHSDGSDTCQIINYYLTPNGKSLNKQNKPRSLDKTAYLHTYANSITNTQALYNNNQEIIFVTDKVVLNAKCLTRALRAPPNC